MTGDGDVILPTEMEERGQPPGMASSWTTSSSSSLSCRVYFDPKFMIDAVKTEVVVPKDGARCTYSYKVFLELRTDQSSDFNHADERPSRENGFNRR